MTRQAMLYGAVNLAQGFPIFRRPTAIKRAAQEAIGTDINQYAITWGRKICAMRSRADAGGAGDCGRSGERSGGVLRIDGSDDRYPTRGVQPGDEVVVFEPFYENYGPDAVLSGAKPRFVSLRPPQVARGEWTFDEQELREAFLHKSNQSHTKAIIVNTPNNPTGKVFSRKELELIRDLCVEITCLRSRTRSTSTFSTTDRSTFHWLVSTGCANGRLRLTGFQRATALRDGAWGGRLRLRRSRMRSGRCMTF